MFGKLKVHGEMAHFWTDGGKDDDFLHVIIGGNYTWDDLISDHDLTLTLEYAREDITQHATATNIASGSDIGRVFKNSILPKFTYEFNDKTKIETFTVFNFSRVTDYYLQPQFTHKITDDLKMETGFDLFYGDHKGFFGQFGNNDRFFFNLTYLF
jgi:hypothetical protein